MKRIRRSLLVLLGVLAVLAASSATAQGVSTDIFRYSGGYAHSEFSRTDGCVTTAAVEEATSGRGALNLASTKVVMEFYTYDHCTDELISAYSCTASSGTVTVIPPLDGATIAATLDCTAWTDVTDTCTLTKNETLTAVSPVLRSVFTFQYTGEYVRVVQRSTGRFRHAEVTSASISGCGVTFTEADAVGDAYLSWSSSGSVYIWHLEPS
jgi:hypothetical protein